MDDQTRTEAGGETVRDVEIPPDEPPSTTTSLDEALDEIIAWIEQTDRSRRDLSGEADGELNADLHRLYAAQFHDAAR